MDRDLPQINKRVLVRGRGIQSEKFHHAIRHKIDEALRLVVRKPGVTNVREVEALHAGLDEGVGKVEGELADVEEGEDPDGFVSAAPKVQEGLQRMSRKGRGE